MINHRRKRNGVVYYWSNGSGTLDTTTANVKLNKPGGTSTTYPNATAASASKTLRIATSAGTVVLNQVTNVGKLYNDLATGTTIISGSSTNKLNFTGGGATISTTAGGTLTVNSDITSDVALNVIGAGTLIVNGTRTDTKGTNLVGGTYSLNSANAVGTGGTISFSGGTLQQTVNNSTDYSSRVSTSPGQQYKIDTTSTDVTLGSALASQGSTLTKMGNGSLFLARDAVCSGSVAILTGTLVLGTGSTSGNILGTSNFLVSSNAKLCWNFSQEKTLDSSVTISGAGGLIVSGSGVIMSGAQSYTGPTNVYGKLTLASSNALNGSGQLIFSTSPYTNKIGKLVHTSDNVSDYSAKISTVNTPYIDIDSGNNNITYSNLSSVNGFYLKKSGDSKMTLLTGSTISAIIPSGSFEISNLNSGGEMFMGFQDFNNIGNIDEMHGIKLSPDGTKAYCYGNNGISVVDTNTGSLIKRIVLADSYISSIAINQDGSKIYAAKYGTVSGGASYSGPGSTPGTTIFVIDTNTYAVTNMLCGAGPRMLKISPNGNFLYISCEIYKGIYCNNISTNQSGVAAYIATSNWPNWTTKEFDISSDGTTMVIRMENLSTAGSSHAKVLVNTTTGDLTEVVNINYGNSAGSYTRGVAVVSNNQFWSINTLDNTLSVVDMTSNSWSKIDTISVSSLTGNALSPEYLTISNDKSKIYVSSATCLGAFSASSRRLIDFKSIAYNSRYNSFLSTFDTNGNLVYAIGTLDASSTKSYLRKFESKNIDVVIGNNSNISLRVLGDGTFTKNGTGIATLSNNSIFDGKIQVNTGTIQLSNSTAFTFAGKGISIAPDAELRISSGANVFLSGSLFLSGTGISAGGSLRSVSGINALYAPSIVLSGSSRINCDANSLLVSSSINSLNNSMTFGGSGNITLNNFSNFGTGSFNKDGTGTLTLKTPNAISGTINILTGTLAVVSASSLGSTTGILNVSQGAILDLTSLGTTSTITKAQLNASGSTLKFNVGTATGESNKLAINGNVNVSNTLFGVNTSGTFTEGLVDLLTYTGTITGTPQSAVQVGGNIKSATLTNNTSQKKIQATISMTPASLLSSNFSLMTYQGTIQKGNANGELKIWDTTTGGGGWGPSPLNNPRGGIVLSNTTLNSGAKTVTMLFKLNYLPTTEWHRPRIGLGLMDSGLQIASFITAWFGASSSSGGNWFRIMSAQTSTYGAPVSAYTTATYNRGMYTNGSSQTIGYDFPQQVGTVYGTRIVDDGTKLTYYSSADGGASWSYLCESGGYGSSNYTGAGFSSSPTRFGLYIIGPNGSSMDVSVTGIEIT